MSRALINRYKQNLTAYCQQLREFCTRRGVVYMFTGTQTVRYEDGHEETYNAGDCFYMTPGHSPTASAGPGWGHTPASLSTA